LVKQIRGLTERNREVQIVEYAREHRRVTIGDTVALTGTSRNTLKQQLPPAVGKGAPGHARQRPRRLVCVGIAPGVGD